MKPNMLVSLLISLLSVTSISALPAQKASTGLKETSESSEWQYREVGARNTKDWRIWLEKDGCPASFWHDVPLYPTINGTTNDQIINFVVEIPRWTDGKIEIKRDEPFNPIFHDERNGAPRFVESVWPLKSYPFLYGSVPQTWESPNFEHPFTGFEGDNDPIDLFDIGQDPGFVGQIKQVKVLGGLALNDGNETDWKLIAIDINDPIAPLVNSYEDVEKYRPGIVQAYRDWFTYYKVARGDGLLPIVGETYQSVPFIKDVLTRGHQYWSDLIQNRVDSNEINFNQTSVSEAGESFVGDACKRGREWGVGKGVKGGEEGVRPERYGRWFYLKDGEVLSGNEGEEEE